MRRPDLLSVEADLRAANANIAAARAAFYPSVDLSAGVSTLLTSGADIIGSTAASLSAPIFSGGRLAAQTESAIAQRDALVARYEQAAYSAFRDVDIALSSIRTADLREAELAISETASARALELAERTFWRVSFDPTFAVAAAGSTVPRSGPVSTNHSRVSVSPSILAGLF